MAGGGLVYAIESSGNYEFMKYSRSGLCGSILVYAGVSEVKLYVEHDNEQQYS